MSEAVIKRELWTERDPRVPTHRRIDADGHPTITEIEDGIRAAQTSTIGLLAVERKAAGDVIGYCGLVDSKDGQDGEQELAFELLRRVWGRGYATEAAWAVLDWARAAGYEPGVCHGVGLEHRLAPRAVKARIHRVGTQAGR